ncbi:MAG: hypothetical protein WCI87_08205 [Euryarchaeota archaeon]
MYTEQSLVFKLLNVADSDRSVHGERRSFVATSKILEPEPSTNSPQSNHQVKQLSESGEPIAGDVDARRLKRLRRANARLKDLELGVWVGFP